MLLDGTFDAVYKAPLVLGYVYNRILVGIYIHMGSPCG